MFIFSVLKITSHGRSQVRRAAGLSHRQRRHHRPAALADRIGSKAEFQAEDGNWYPVTISRITPAAAPKTKTHTSKLSNGQEQSDVEPAKLRCVSVKGKIGACCSSTRRMT